MVPVACLHVLYSIVSPALQWASRYHVWVGVDNTGGSTLEAMVAANLEAWSLSICYKHKPLGEYIFVILPMLYTHNWKNPDTIDII